MSGLVFLAGAGVGFVFAKIAEFLLDDYLTIIERPRRAHRPAMHEYTTIKVHRTNPDRPYDWQRDTN